VITTSLRELNTWRLLSSETRLLLVQLRQAFHEELGKGSCGVTWMLKVEGVNGSIVTGGWFEKAQVLFRKERLCLSSG
jgi:hypothetical protein